MILQPQHGSNLVGSKDNELDFIIIHTQNICTVTAAYLTRFHNIVQSGIYCIQVCQKSQNTHFSQKLKGKWNMLFQQVVCEGAYILGYVRNMTAVNALSLVLNKDTLWSAPGTALSFCVDDVWTTRDIAKSDCSNQFETILVTYKMLNKLPSHWNFLLWSNMAAFKVAAIFWT